MADEGESGHSHADCFDCHKPIESGQSHIHVDMDNFGVVEGIRDEPLGIGQGFLVFPIHSAHLVKSEQGWQPHKHKIAPVDTRHTE